ncbi:hypothetical protein CEUSTIGMA_g7413.t1 [Chlamydomonas eustigma]|uniref:Uncharacterized protein n=1 Tax=Chlamydomonas eustigma TaxID=1157962 RepID=A0A250XA83_9CHLO|nr:hypothetical protein CEUSTIGMA_g7413.t1 [Chlamydomonas eustigma]|eukprot:GAX79974.1 hypothetical protein CEUSTIGMA_g7413.t1 [Chlamydomonas eustigma]
MTKPSKTRSKSIAERKPGVSVPPPPGLYSSHSSETKNSSFQIYAGAKSQTKQSSQANKQTYGKKTYDPQHAEHGLANQFVHVEFEPKEGLWKVSLPHGQRFSKQFLAGVEVWALQALNGGQKVGATPSQTLKNSIATPPPPPPKVAPEVKQPVVTLLPGPSTSAFDFTSFLQPLNSAASNQSQHALSQVVAVESIQQQATEHDEVESCEGSEGDDFLSAMRGIGGPDEGRDSQFEEAGGFNSDDVEDEGEEEEEEEEREGGREIPKQQVGRTGQTIKKQSDEATSGSASNRKQANQLNTPNPSRGLRPAPGSHAALPAAAGRPGRCKGSGLDGRLNVSLQLERQQITDVEVQMLRNWYQERAEGLITLVKVWLFENSIGDEGALALSTLFHPELLEVHLSHNQVTNKGMFKLLAAVPLSRVTSNKKPLWLRCEWNILNLKELEAFIRSQKESRGLIVHLPQVSKAPAGSGHELRLDRRAGSDVHVQLPWINMQKQPPRESKILLETKIAYRQSQVTKVKLGLPSATAKQLVVAEDAALLPPLGTVTTHNNLPSSELSVPTVRMNTLNPAAPLKKDAASSVNTPQTPPPVYRNNTQQGYNSGGPLLLFPDTSAVLAMLGAQGGNSGGSEALLSFQLFQDYAEKGRFGQALEKDEQTFIVISDSVMKQLDGLKSVPELRVGIRKFLKDGLEMMGPSGYDFLTILGAHEGEGLLLENGGMGSAGSSSPFISSKGQKVDFKIVEVALFFMTELLGCVEDHEGSRSDMPGTQQRPASTITHMPVVLLSNDNAQIAAARANGLPSFRLSSPGDLALKLQELGRTSPLTSSVLRTLLAPQATSGLGATPLLSLQKGFDQAFAAVNGLNAGLQIAAKLLHQVQESAFSNTLSPSEALSQIRALLEMEDAEGGASHAGAVVQSLITSTREQVSAWEALVERRQHPNRILQWVMNETSTSHA